MKKFLMTVIAFCISLFMLLAQDVTENYINVSQGKLYYEDAGTGEPVIFIHGHSLDTRMWDAQFFPFSEHYRVIRYDARGYGRSSKQCEGSICPTLQLVTLLTSEVYHSF